MVGGVCPYLLLTRKTVAGRFPARLQSAVNIPPVHERTRQSGRVSRPQVLSNIIHVPSPSPRVIPSSCLRALAASNSLSTHTDIAIDKLAMSIPVIVTSDGSRLTRTQRASVKEFIGNISNIELSLRGVRSAAFTTRRRQGQYVDEHAEFMSDCGWRTREIRTCQTNNPDPNITISRADFIFIDLVSYYDPRYTVEVDEESAELLSDVLQDLVGPFDDEPANPDELPSGASRALTAPQLIDLADALYRSREPILDGHRYRVDGQAGDLFILLHSHGSRDLSLTFSKQPIPDLEEHDFQSSTDGPIMTYAWDPAWRRPDFVPYIERRD
jgi:hypothetical protein